MTNPINQPPLEPFAAERPVRSEMATLPRSYRVRRIVTCCVLAAIIGGVGYGIYAFNRAPTEIPIIKAEGVMKQKPEQPGGINIPNQDVLAYQQIDNSADKTPPAEHLLPPPETPQAQPAPQAAAPPAPSTPAVESLLAPPAPPPIVTTASQKPKASTDEAPTPSAAPRSEVTSADSNTQAQQMPTTPADQSAQQPTPNNLKTGASVTPASLPAASSMRATEPSAPAKDENNSAPQKSGKSGFRIQLASFPDIDTARHEMKRMEKRYASQLGDAKIHIAKADLGPRGVYYRLQSNPITDSEAHDICKSITKIKTAGCIVVKP